MTMTVTMEEMATLFCGSCQRPIRQIPACEKATSYEICEACTHLPPAPHEEDEDETTNTECPHCGSTEFSLIRRMVYSGTGEEAGGEYVYVSTLGEEDDDYDSLECDGCGRTDMVPWAWS